MIAREGESETSSLNSLESRKQQQRRFDAQNEAAARKIKDSLGMYKPESERDMMDRLMPPGPSSGRAAGAERRGGAPATSAKVLRPSTNASNENGTSLLTSMASRLTALEKSHRKLRSELVAKDREVLRWKGKYQALASTTHEEDGFDRCRADSWAGACERAASQASSRNGVFFARLRPRLGGPGADERGGGQRGETAESIGARIDFGLLFARLKELNVLAGEGKAKIRTEGRAARFDWRKLPLAVYKDGIFFPAGAALAVLRPRPSGSCRTCSMATSLPKGIQRRVPWTGIILAEGLLGMLFKEASTASEASQRAPARPFEAFGGEGQQIGSSSEQTAPMTREEFLRPVA